jgi:single-stranded DNA-binding protein
MGKGKPTHTSFFPITIWGKFAERTAPKLIKGCTVFISCTGRIEKYKDKNGVDRYPFKCTIGPTDIIRFTYKSKEAQQRHEQLKNQSNNTQQQQYFNNSSRPEYRVPSTGNPVVGQPVQSQGAQQVLDIFEGDFQDDIPF